MITPRQSTVAMPLTVVDHVADLQKCLTVDEVAKFSELLPPEIVEDERYGRGVRNRLAEIREARGHLKRVA